MKARLALLLLLSLASLAALAEEQPVPLKDADGREIVENNCGSCHSLDYPRTNGSFMGRQAWEAEVNKMINAFGAPIEPADAKAIVDYLAKNYGTGG
jgi:mono/diheme cytochrome c family protein